MILAGPILPVFNGAGHAKLLSIKNIDIKQFAPVIQGNQYCA